MNALAALLGLQGGAQGVGQGLNQWGAQRQKQDAIDTQKAQFAAQQAAQLEEARARFTASVAGQGYVPRGTLQTPTASTGQFGDMHAHQPTGESVPSVPEIANESGPSPTLDQPQGPPPVSGAIPGMQRPQMQAPVQPSYQAPPQQGQALAQLIAPPSAPQSLGSFYGQEFVRPANYEPPEDRRAALAEKYRVADADRKEKADSTRVAAQRDLQRNGIRRMHPELGDEALDAILTSPTATAQYLGPKPTKDPALHEVVAPDGSKTLQPTTPGMQIAPPSKITVKPLAAPIAAKVGQFGEMLKKAHDLTSMTDNLDVTMGQSATRDLAEHGVHVPLLGTIPGSKGVGNALMNHSASYTQYQAALSPFILAAAHALSGARINQDQVEQIRKSIELAPGDFANKEVRAQKEKNLIDLINSIGGSLPVDAISAQEGQMDEPSLAGLAARGYRRTGGSTPAVAPSSGGRTVILNGKTYHLPP